MSDNPYVGPRPFTEKERLFGRDREIRTLYYTLCADRIVLLHSPSGAGKSSLIQSGLLPRMRKEFAVWGPARVYLPPPGGFPKDANPFVMSVAPGKTTLQEYFHELRAASKKNLFLVFDQFEEVLTKEPLNKKAKTEFFRQLGELLHDPGMYALFAMREDYLAAIGPYVELLPTHLLNRCRIDLLGKEAALEAIREPAALGGRPFTKEALEGLSRDLSLTQAQTAEGKTEWVEGDIIEPLQLQVACHELWRQTSSPKADGSAYTKIDDDALKAFGSVSNSLAAYYTSCVETIAHGDKAKERMLRDWFGRKLVSPKPESIRLQVLRRIPESEGLDTKLIEDELVPRHLVRPENRGTATYFELSHDQLIKPVHTSNDAWNAKNLHEVQVRAEYWDTHDRADELLLQPAEYQAAQEWASKQTLLTKAETLFLSDSRARWMEAEIAAQRERRHHQAVQRGFYMALAALAAAVVFGIFGWVKKEEAAASLRVAAAEQLKAQQSIRVTRWNKVLLESQQYNADDSRLRAEQAAEDAAQQEQIQFSLRLGSSVRANILPEETQYDLAALLSREAFHTADTYEARSAIFATLQASPRLIGYLHHSAPLRSVAVSPDGVLLATAGADGAVRLWDAGTRAPLAQFNGHGGAATRVVFISGGQALASAGADGSVRIWDVKTRAPAPLASIRSQNSRGVSAMTWNETKSLLALGRVDGDVELYRIDDPNKPTPAGSASKADHPRDQWRPGIFDLKFNPGGSLLAVSGPSLRVQIWEVRPNEDPRARLRLPTGNIDTLQMAFDAQGSRIALAGLPAVEIWSLRNLGRPAILAVTDTEKGLASSVAFQPNGNLLAVGYEKELVTLYELSADNPANTMSAGRPEVADTLGGHGGDVPDLVFTPDGKRLATVGDDRDAIMWSVGDVSDPLQVEAPQVPGQGGVAFGPSPGGWLMAAGSSTRILLYQRNGVTTRQVGEVTCDGYDNPFSVALSSDSAFLAVGRWGASTACAWDLKQRGGPKKIELDGPRIEDAHVAFHPSRPILAVGGKRAGTSKSSLVLYDLSQGTARALPDPPLNPRPDVTDIRNVAFNRDGNLLAAAYGNQGVVVVWDVTTPTRSRLLATLSGHTGAVLSLAFHPKGWFLASGGDDRNVVLWDLSNPRSIQQHSVLKGHGNWVWSIAFAPDGETLAAGVRNGRTLVWDVGSGLQLGESLRQEGEVFGVAFTPDGKTLASHSDEDGLRFWNHDPRKLLGNLCGLANRNLSAAEWQQYIGDINTYARTCPEFPDGAGVAEKRRQ